MSSGRLKTRLFKTVLLLAAGLALGGLILSGMLPACSAGGGFGGTNGRDGAPAAGDAPGDGLGAPGSVAPTSATPSGGGKGGETGGAGRGGKRSGGGAAWQTLATVNDSRGDHTGIDQGPGPGYGDLTAITVASNSRSARFTVTMAASVPARLGAGEVAGIGVDLYRTSGKESDYQVFLDGGSSGWRAYLQTPKGFVKFPGSFTLSGRSLVVTLPWSTLGGRRDGSVSVFADWSSGGTLRRATADQAPDTGATRLRVVSS